MRESLSVMNELKSEIWEKLSREVCSTGLFTLNNENVLKENVSRIQVTCDDLEIDGSLNIKFNGICDIKLVNNDHSFKQSPAYFSGKAKCDGENIVITSPINVKAR